jgi:dTDP-4-dehydrorhamnose reductase
MKVFVLGHKGMLGHVVARHLAQQGCEVVTTPLRYVAQARDPLVEAVRESECSWVVNAIGRIKQKTDNPADMYLANSLLPIHLGLRLHSGQRLIQAGTDCIFSGKKGNYSIDSQQDAEDVYGLSKSIGEKVVQAGRCWVIRTSIIGPELAGGSGLMGWFLRQSGQVNGYTNHLWNGVTSLDWAKISWELMSNQLKTTGPIIQAGFSPPLSKYDILKLIARIWNRPVEVRAVETAEAIDRTLVPEVVRPELSQQLLELKAWYDVGAPTAK